MTGESRDKPWVGGPQTSRSVSAASSTGPDGENGTKSVGRRWIKPAPVHITRGQSSKDFGCRDGEHVLTRRAVAQPPEAPFDSASPPRRERGGNSSAMAFIQRQLVEEEQVGPRPGRNHRGSGLGNSSSRLGSPPPPKKGGGASSACSDILFSSRALVREGSLSTSIAQYNHQQFTQRRTPKLVM